MTEVTAVDTTNKAPVPAVAAVPDNDSPAPSVMAEVTAVTTANEAPVPAVAAVPDNDNPVPAVMTEVTAVVTATECPEMTSESLANVLNKAPDHTVVEDRPIPNSSSPSPDNYSFTCQSDHSPYNHSLICSASAKGLNPDTALEIIDTLASLSLFTYITDRPEAESESLATFLNNIPDDALFGDYHLPNSSIPNPDDHHFTYSSNPRSDSPNFTCPVCVEDLNRHTELETLDCNCLICKNCVRLYIKTADINTLTASGLPCPKCDKIIGLEQVRKFAGKTQYERINSIIISIITSPAENYRCTADGCNMIMYIEKNTLQRSATCLNTQCNATICTSCKASPYHDSMTCDDFQKQQDSKNEEKELPHNIFPCPSCKSYIELVAGCNLVTCLTCKSQICAECKRLITEGYAHFKHGKCLLNNPEIPDFAADYVPLAPPHYGIRNNTVEPAWLAKHLKYRTRHGLTVFLNRTCDDCGTKQRFTPIVTWDCKHQYCYYCGATMFKKHPSLEHQITFTCRICLACNIPPEKAFPLSASNDYTLPTGNSHATTRMLTCNLCQLHPRMSTDHLYCSQCIEEGRTLPDQEARTMLEPRNNYRECQLCDKSIKQSLSEYCRDCNHLLETGWTVH
ncbi:MAG: hypothetical protein QS748_01485 [Candidatus Endonucleobacter bathymodioli]|uniref:RING-type domain-containing protein n=1 Tax=Candidatus Endonucleibacter bathymodioli TaxID=539814 RepID=A0AA90NJD8_9GAMM|nr:hypothetical protein [Candidatus Endonucleobacter bathymodioli]